jgi:amidase
MSDSMHKFLRLSAAFCILLLATGCAGVHRDTAFAATEFELAELTVPELQEAMASGRYTSRQLVELYLQRIEAIDQGGPALRAILAVNPDALRIADELDAERQERGPRGPLHGIPVVLKDNIDTADRMSTTAGALALEGSIAPQDAHVVAQLRAAGAVILAKTNLSEWANFRSTNSSSGWSALGGQTKNPYALDRSPCGSSSGSGVAVAANLAAVAVGTETDGSVVCPASANGIVGIKPTVGLVGRSGIIPISHTQDTAGPMARTVTDAAILLTAMTGRDPRDPATDAAVDKAHDYAAGLDAGALDGARIGISRARHFGYSPDADRLVEAAIEAMKAQGAVIVDPVEIPTVDRLGECELEVLLYEFKDGLNAYLATLGPGARVRSLTELIAFNERQAARSMPFFGQERLVMAEERGPLTSSDYLTHLDNCRRWAGPEGIDAVIREHNLDALVAPTISPAWPIDLVNGDHYLGASSSPAAVAGYPNITVPAGEAFGLPVGISFFGAAWTEAQLIRLAYAFEQATRHRRTPGLLPTIELGDD